ncbi:Agarase [Paenibacillus mucilaginosus 3016]|uniref:Agarase n=1 Tax=Paenibacillus mucilaginosus 3016 TaxID=1116391 RepID=H6NQS6_9BACL|nr:sugar-binding protein [Paenibacillus mucilaginosus]AFC27240.1 Agarase [Paenibacillus mucilaginosus 3016]
MNVRRLLSGGCAGVLLFSGIGVSNAAGTAGGSGGVSAPQLKTVTYSGAGAAGEAAVNGTAQGGAPASGEAVPRLAADAGGSAGTAETETQALATAVQVDRFGQWVSATFPEKVTSESQLLEDVAADAAYYGALQAPDWDPYGGLKGSREQYGLNATGFYSIQEAAGRKVMVTPEGNLFFSLGVNGIAPTDTYTVVTGREGIYEWIPPYESEYKSAFLNTKDNFSYYLANRIRKTGQPYTSRSLYTEGIQRIRKWGFNTAAGWTPVNLSREFSVPHVPFLPLSDMAWAKVNGLKFFDIFVDGAEAKLDAALGPLLTEHKNNPYIIGYFFGNESYYHKLAPDLPKMKGSEVAAKRRLVQMLQEKYGTIEAFNAAWNGTYASFTALIDAPLYIDSQQAQYDVDDFVKLYLDTFFGTVSRVFRKYDPNHLLIGDRWLTLPVNNVKVRGFLAEAAGRHLDVISINHYSKNLDTVMLNHIHQASGGKPIMLTEIGYGSSEQGLGAPTQMLVADQNERMLRYRNYVEGAASLGYIVGVHWFAYLDQAATGRWAEGTTGERYNFGLLNVADRPYKPFLEGVMASNKDIYPVLLGQRVPFKHEFGDVPRQPGTNKMEIPYTPAPIPIDGEVNGFPGDAAAVTLGPGQLVNGTGGEGMQGEYTFAWDENRLYVTAVIKDPTPMKNNNPNINVWRGDGVELFFGPQDLTTPGDPLFLDRQLIASAGLNNGQPFWYWYFTNRQKPVEMAVKLLPDGSGYVLEAALTWDSINLQGQADTRFLFDFGFDDSEDGNTRKRQWVWNGTSANSTNRGHWGQATLVKRAAPAIRITGVEEGGDYTDEVLPVVEVEDATGVRSRTVTLDGAPWTDGTPVTAPGSHELTVEAVNTVGITAKKTVTFAVYGSTALELSPAAGQYSDEVQLEAKLSGSSGGPVPGAELSFEVNGSAAGTAVTDAQGRAVLPYRISTGPESGQLSVKAAYTPAAGLYLRPAASEGALTVRPEDAALQYTGETYVKERRPAVLSAQVVQADDGSAGALSGLPVRFTVSEVRPDGTLRELAGVTDSVYATGADGRAEAAAQLPPGLYEVRAELLAGPLYKAPAPVRSTLAVAAPVAGHSVTVNGTVPGGTFLGKPAGTLVLNSMVSYDLAGGLTGALRVSGEPGGAELYVKSFDWLVIAGDRAYVQGTAVSGRQTYTVRLLLKELTTVSLYVWKGRDTSAEPVHKQLNAQLTGAVLTLP